MYYLVDISYLNQDTEKKEKQKVLVKPLTNSYTEVESIIIDKYSKEEFFSLDKITKKDFNGVTQREEFDDHTPFHELSVNIADEESVLKEKIVMPAKDSEEAIKAAIEAYEQGFSKDSIKVVKYQLSKIDTFIEVV